MDTSWDINKYREEHDSDEHWSLRKAFMERWKNDYPEQRLVTLARTFYNVEVLGCTYPPELMKEVELLSKDIAQEYRESKKNKLQRTFVSASDAAEDRARGVKREGGVIKDAPPAKSKHINFVKQGTSDDGNDKKSSGSNIEDYNAGESSKTYTPPDKPKVDKSSSGCIDKMEYLKEFTSMVCTGILSFRETMFDTPYGKLVLLIRPWTSRICNIKASFQTCRIPLETIYDKTMYKLIVNGKVIVEIVVGKSKQEAKAAFEAAAWDKIKYHAISLLVKEQWIAHGSAPVSISDVSGVQRPDSTFGTPLESSVASKMMQLMGWNGGGLGAESQGIAEPIRPHFEMVNRAGLGSTSSDLRQIKRAAHELMQRYISSSHLDVDLVFSSDFSKEERAALHQCAKKSGLASKSYGSNEDRFLVVKKKLEPFSLVKAVVEAGGNTAKYQVFIPVSVSYAHPV